MRASIDRDPIDTEQAMRTFALAIGIAARFAVKLGFTDDQAAELMRRAWFIVQDKEIVWPHGETTIDRS